MSIIQGTPRLLGGKTSLIHLASHREVAEHGGAFALCGEWVTTPDDKSTPVSCRPCLRQERKEQRGRRQEAVQGYDPDDLYSDLYSDLYRDDDDSPGTGMMRY